MASKHAYRLQTTWTGNSGQGTSTYTGYERSHTIQIEGKQDLLASSDPAFRGDRSRHNPEELLLAALSSCHMLSYLHLCVKAGVVVTDYTDQAEGIMEETPNGGGHFTQVILKPIVTVSQAHMIEIANALHKKANELCFIASSVNFPVIHEAGANVK